MMDNGQLVEFGPPGALLNNGNGAFAAVFREQMKKGRVA
jgi:ABC-type multidrug transport system fused ATPase/permease subunit